MRGIVAKVTRDRIMEEFHVCFPHYGWNHNAGYGTQEHIYMIRTHGMTEHRTQFVHTALRKYK
jgi:ribonuclease HII